MCAVRLFAAMMILAGAFHLANAQSVNSIRISPSEPTTLDTILVISDFSYYGACEYGLVYEYSHTDDTSIYLAPTYCGYFLQDSVLCQSIDTFKVGPLTTGTYALNIEYHQGSVCPISGFDATIAEFDTSIIVVGTNKTTEHYQDLSILLVYPNPASKQVTIEIKNKQDLQNHRLLVRNVLGQDVYDAALNVSHVEINTINWHGLYIVMILDGNSAVNYVMLMVE